MRKQATTCLRWPASHIRLDCACDQLLFQ